MSATLAVTPTSLGSPTQRGRGRSRGASLSRQIKTAHNEQLLQMSKKFLADTEILEEFKEFSRKVASLEAEYAQGLQKVSAHLIAKVEQHIDTAEDEAQRLDSNGDIETYVPANQILLNFALQMKQRGKDHENLSEVLQTVYEDVKQECRGHSNSVKKVNEQHLRIQEDFHFMMKDMEKKEKVYRECDKNTISAREKYEEVTGENGAAVKRTGSGLFKKKEGGEKITMKLQSKLDIAEQQCNKARNDCLLSVSAAEAIEQHYITSDIPNFLLDVDTSYYSTLSTALTTVVSNARIICEHDVRIYTDLLAGLGKLKTNKEHKSLLQNPKFYTPTEYKLLKTAKKNWDDVSSLNGSDASMNEELITDIVSDSSQANLLQEEMLRAIEEEIAAQRQVKEGEAVLENLKKIKDDATINSDDLNNSNTQASTNTNTIKETLRENKWALQSARAKIALLQKANVPVCKRGEQLLEENAQLFSSDFVFQDETEESNPAPTSATGARYVATYDYAKMADGELDIWENDEVTLLETHEDGWSLVKNETGSEGLVPTAYLELLDSSSTHPRPSRNDQSSTCYSALYDYTAADEQELSYLEGAQFEYISGDMEDNWITCRNVETGEVGLVAVTYVEKI